MAVARLAERHASELLDVVRRSRELAPIALDALAQCREAPTVLGELAQLASELSRPDRVRLLDTIVTIARRRPTQSEPLAPDSTARAVRLLHRLSRDTDEPKPVRARAVSALRALARSGRIDPASITKAVDPR